MPPGMSARIGVYVRERKKGVPAKGRVLEGDGQVGDED